jgi:hypothetical protein
VALDLRPAELGILVPLVACLLALSAWPAAISGNALGPSISPGAPQERHLTRPNDQPPEGRMEFVTMVPGR